MAQLVEYSLVCFARLVVRRIIHDVSLAGLLRGRQGFALNSSDFFISLTTARANDTILSRGRGLLSGF